MIITVDVKSNSRVNRIEKLSEHHYLVSVKVPAIKNKANKAVLKLLKDYFGLQVYLVAGHSSNRKKIEVKE